MRRWPVVVSLPIDYRRAWLAFYRDGLGFEPVVEPAYDGMAEPQQLAVHDSVQVGAASAS